MIEKEDIHSIFSKKDFFVPISCVKLGLNYRICFWKLPFKMCTHCKNSSFEGSCWFLMKWFYILFLKRAKNVNSNIKLCKLSFYSLLKHIFLLFWIKFSITNTRKTLMYRNYIHLCVIRVISNWYQCVFF